MVGTTQLVAHWVMLRPSQTLSDFSRDVQAQALPNRMAATLPGAKS